MTTTATTPALEAVAPFDLAPHRAARVDLMPPEILGARRLATTQKILAVALAGVLLTCAGAWAVSSASVGSANAQVTAAQTRSAALHAQEAQYAGVTPVLNQIDRVRSAERHAMVGDVAWTDLLDAVNRGTPDGVWLTAMSVTLDTSVANTGTLPAALDPLADPAVATLTVSGYGSSHDDVAAWLDGLTAVPGLSDARYSLSTRTELQGEVVTQFSSTVGVTAAALTHRFDRGDD